MSGPAKALEDHIPQVKAVKSHFISGEPGTTGREPFEDSSASGPGHAFSAIQPGTGAGSNAGVGAGSGLMGSHHQGDGYNHGLTGTGDNHRGVDPLTAGSGLAAGAGGAGATGLAHNSNTHSSGLTGLKGDHSRGTHGISAESDARTSGIAGTGLDPNHKSHFSNDKPTRHTNENEYEDRTLAEKAKSAIGLGGSSNLAVADKDNRSVVDKINDVLPGTPAKHNDHNTGVTGDRHNGAATGAGLGAGAGAAGLTGAHAHGSHGHTGLSATSGSTLHTGQSAGNAYGPGHTHADRDDVGTGTAYGAGKHGTDHYGPGHTGADNREIGIAGSGVSGHKDHDSSRSGILSSGSDNHENRIEHDTSQRAPGQSKGGLSGLLATSDKDFTGRERQGKGAYADTDGKFELNTSGPAGNTALTGREGNLDNNPVHQAKTRDGTHDTSLTNVHSSNATAHDAAVHGEQTGEKKGLLQKVKDLL